VIKRCCVVLFLLLVPCLILAQSAPSSSDARFFMPKDAFWGWGQFDIAPPHNEVDPNLCASNAKSYGGKNAPCNAFGRYMFSGNIEFRPFGKTQLRRLVIWTDPVFLFGKNVPQALYTWSMKPIGVEQSWGVGVDLPYRFQMRVTQHFLYTRLGSTNNNMGAADLGYNGPYGRYNTIGVRKYFGRQREGVQ
jgi:hypothetical protein